MLQKLHGRKTKAKNRLLGGKLYFLRLLALALSVLGFSRYAKAQDEDNEERAENSNHVEFASYISAFVNKRVSNLLQSSPHWRSNSYQRLRTAAHLI